MYMDNYNNNINVHTYMYIILLENNAHELYWNRSITIDRIFPYNKPGIRLTSIQNKITYLIEILIPNTQYSSKNSTVYMYVQLAEEVCGIKIQSK